MFDVNSYFDYGTADFAADDSLADAQGLFVTLQANGQFAVDTTPGGAETFGVLRDNCLEAEVPAVRTGSITYVYAGEALSPGDFVTNDAAGKAVVATTGDTILGQVLEEAVAADEEGKINMFLQPARTVSA